MASDREKLRELIRTEPTVRGTFEAIEAQIAAIESAAPLIKRREELKTRLAEIEAAKNKLA